MVTQLAEPVPLSLYIQNLDAGGAQPIMVNLANALARRGIAATLIANNTRGIWRKAVSEGVVLHDLRAANSLQAAWNLSLYLRATRPPILISALAHSNFAAVAAVRASQSATKLVIVEHTTTSRWLESQRPSRKVAFRSLLPFLYRRADQIVSVSQGAAKDLAGVLGTAEDKIAVIYNASPAGKDLEGLAPLDCSWLTGSPVPVFIAAGRMAPEKNFDVLLNAFSSLRKRRPARLLLLGDGPLRARLERQAQDLRIDADVRFEGYVADVLAYFLHGSAFVLSSRFEGFPLVMVEALSSGLPVVSTDCESGPREILDGGRLGKLVPVGDAEALAAAMFDTLESPCNPAELRRRAEDFSLERMVESYIALANRTLGLGSTSP